MRVINGTDEIKGENLSENGAVGVEFDLSDSPDGLTGAEIRNSALVLGYFDGVHIGHTSQLEKAHEHSDRVVVRMFSSINKKAGKSLTLLGEKLRLLSLKGVDTVILDDFSAMRDLTGREYFERAILPLHPAGIFCGYNFTFGRGAACSSVELKQYAWENDIPFTSMPEFRLEDSAVSATEIRSLLSRGEVEKAAVLSGRYYSVKDTVVHGKELGRTIDFPTVNLRPTAEKLLPADGIYACLAVFGENGQRTVHGGVCNIGYRPTVNDDKSDKTLETYIFDYHGNLYSHPVRIIFTHRLRGEVRFSSVDELRSAIAKDAQNARIRLKHTDEALLKDYENTI